VKVPEGRDSRARVVAENPQEQAPLVAEGGVEAALSEVGRLEEPVDAVE
jgi:hypothetical protein